MLQLANSFTRLHGQNAERLARLSADVGAENSRSMKTLIELIRLEHFAEARSRLRTLAQQVKGYGGATAQVRAGHRRDVRRIGFKAPAEVSHVP